jgi:hypothetical protein
MSQLDTTATEPSTPTDQRTPEHTEPAGSFLNLAEVVAAIPAAVDNALRKTCPDQYTPELAAEIAAGTIARLTAATPSSPVRAELTGLAADQCCARRPGRDPLTGNRTDGLEETEESWRDRLLCTERHGHDGDHRDGLKRTWAEVSA